MNLCKFHSMNFKSYNMHTIETNRKCIVLCRVNFCIAADHLLLGNHPTCKMFLIRFFLSFLFQQIELYSNHQIELNSQETNPYDTSNVPMIFNSIRSGTVSQGVMAGRRFLKLTRIHENSLLTLSVNSAPLPFHKLKEM